MPNTPWGENAYPLVERLTPRESEVIEEVLEGRTNREIAQRRRVSRQTVKNQLTQVYQKLGVGGRDELRRHWDRTRQRLELRTQKEG